MHSQSNQSPACVSVSVAREGGGGGGSALLSIISVISVFEGPDPRQQEGSLLFTLICGQKQRTVPHASFNDSVITSFHPLHDKYIKTR